MKNLLLISGIVLIFGACNSTRDEAVSNQNSNIILTIDEFYDQPENYIEKEVTIEGLVTHVCKHGGQKLFVTGSEDSHNLRIDVGEDISEFNIQMEGSEALFTGVIYQMDQSFVAASEKEHIEHHHDDTADCPTEANLPSQEKKYYLIARNFQSR